eukprot:TRINITY_DN128202_c0_g1_i1.p1 TRINITY_DN128202_c0_g1~~TRINITY_DN128202_c0_g1_i1.p1  ORF type:complete len:199 (+),score=27.91 TRINITY_DN128202_c0_g1_i1:108-704(+)
MADNWSSPSPWSFDLEDSSDHQRDVREAPRRRTWQELRERLDAGDGAPSLTAGMTLPPASASASASAFAFNKKITQKAPYPNLLPPEEPWLAKYVPDPHEPYAPVRLGVFWGSLGIGLGALRGASLAVFTQPTKHLPRSRAFLLGFCFSAPWYITFLGLAGIMDCYSARWSKSGNSSDRMRLLDSAQACGALGAGELC